MPYWLQEVSTIYTDIGRRRIKKQAAQIKELEKQIKELKELLLDKAKSKESKPPKEASNFSVSRYQQKQRKRQRRKKSTGRKPKGAKRDLITDTIDLYWHGGKRKKWVLRREQFVGRLIDGKAKVNKLQARIRMICRRYGVTLDDTTPADDAKLVRLQNELVDHTEKLFVFVLHPEVEATNNRSERQARAEAMARKAARTSKTESGARRRGVIMSVLASLSKRMKHFTLASVLAEINRWIETGQSVFREELASIQAVMTAPSKLPP